LRELCNSRGIFEAELLEDADLLEGRREAAAPEEVAPFPPDEPELARAGGGLDDVRARSLDHVGVETAAEAPVASDYDDEGFRGGGGLALNEKRMNRGIDARRDARQHALHLHRVRPRIHDALLRAAQFRGGDHLHRLRDLLRILDRADPAPEID